MVRYFKQYVDLSHQDTATSQLNADIENTTDKLISVQFQVVRYENKNTDRTYILAEWEKSQGGSYELS